MMVTTQCRGERGRLKLNKNSGLYDSSVLFLRLPSLGKFWTQWDGSEEKHLFLTLGTWIRHNAHHARHNFIYSGEVRSKQRFSKLTWHKHPVECRAGDGKHRVACRCGPSAWNPKHGRPEVVTSRGWKASCGLDINRAGDKMPPCETPISCSCSSDKVEHTIRLKGRWNRIAFSKMVSY